MDRSVRDSLWACISDFLFPSKALRDGTREQYRGHRLLLWIVLGLSFSALGWIAGAFLGSWAPRTACAVGATALALCWLNRRPGAALVGSVTTAIVCLAAVRIGESFFSPLIAWPAAAVTIGVIGAFAFRRPRARITFIIAAPLLGSIGFLAGMLATFLAAVGLNDSRVSAQTMLGGAAGFGFLLMTGAAIAARWLDTTPAAGRVL